MDLVLHGYCRSGATYRVRIALNLKGAVYEQRSYDLNRGEHHALSYREISPQGLVPVLIAGPDRLIQSSAILEWIEEQFPAPPLLPSSPAERAVVRAMAAIVGTDIHPLNNLRVLTRMREQGVMGPEAIFAWRSHWFQRGFATLEDMVAQYGRGFAFGSSPTLADCYLIPQLYTAARFDVDVSAFPRLRAVADAASAIPAIAAAHPDLQPDALEEDQLRVDARRMER